MMAIVNKFSEVLSMMSIDEIRSKMSSYILSQMDDRPPEDVDYLSEKQISLMIKRVKELSLIRVAKKKNYSGGMRI